MTDKNAPFRLRRTAYLVMVVVAVAMAAGRIASVRSSEGASAFLSANDRSRWATVASLVEDGTYEIDRQLRLRDDRGRRILHTIDLVRHRGDDGALHYYSSKPPLLASMVAVVYHGVRTLTGLTLTEHPIYVPRLLLLLVNLPTLLVFFIATLYTIEVTGTGQASRLVMAAAACLGTMVTPFAVSLTNHLPAAAATALVLAIYLHSIRRQGDGPRLFEGSTVRRGLASGGGRAVIGMNLLWGLAGASAGLAAANELPALSMLGLWGVLFGWNRFRSLVPLSLGVGVVAIAFFVTNDIAHDSFRPPYAHRGTGRVIGAIDARSGDLKASLQQRLVDLNFIAEADEIQLRESAEPGRFVVESPDQQLFALTPAPTTSSAEAVDRYELAHWDDWYEYPGSYWQDGRRRGIDRGEPSRWNYLLHMTVGHHGVFSLTPLWCLLPLGVFLHLVRGAVRHRPLVLAVVLASAVCGLFYLMRPEIDRNYGGVSICFRWLLWFAPLWLFLIVPAVDRLGRSAGGVATLAVLLASSVFSVAVSFDTPWQHPWLYRFADFLGWLG